jgi:CBS domain-containing protein
MCCLGNLNCRLFDALGEVLNGVQNLIISIDRSVSSRLARYSTMPAHQRSEGRSMPLSDSAKLDRQHLSLPRLSTEETTNILEEHGGVQEYCWLTPEDIVRFLLSCIGLFSPLTMMTIQQLGIINSDVLTVDVNADAMSALPLIQKAAREMSAVAVVETDEETTGMPKLVGEISAFTMKECGETAALALSTLSVKGFLSFTQDCGGPSHSLVELVHSRLSQKLKNMHHLSSTGSAEDANMELLAAMYGLESSDDSSDEESAAVHSPTGPLGFSHDLPARISKMQSISKGRVAPNRCRPWSSLVAVMAQALTHRVGYIWVTDDDNSLLGIVTYMDIITCILGTLYSSE